MDREILIREAENWILNQGYQITQKDLQRPWGAYWHIRGEDTHTFVREFFPEQENLTILNVSPKILLVLPDQQLSFQVHRLRSECWRVIQGPVEIIVGDQQQIYHPGDKITIKCHTQHRLMGMDRPGLVAEIWIHMDPQNPSNEEDIIRLKDMYQRK